MNITINENWDTEIIIPLENEECILLVSNTTYSKIKKKIANVNNEKSRRMLMDLYRKHIRCSSKRNKICLPYSIAIGFNIYELELIRFQYEGGKAYFLCNRDSNIKHKIWRYLSARSLEASFVSMEVKSSDRYILNEEENRFTIMVAEMVKQDLGELFNPVCFFGEDYLINNLVNSWFGKITMKAMSLRQVMGEICKTYRDGNEIENSSLLANTFNCFLIENFEEIQNNDDFYATNIEVVRVLKRLTKRNVQIICTASFNLLVDDKLRNHGLDYIQTEVV